MYFSLTVVIVYEFESYYIKMLLLPPDGCNALVFGKEEDSQTSSFTIILSVIIHVFFMSRCQLKVDMNERLKPTHRYLAIP